MDKESDLWETPQWLFEELNTEFHFDIDICANVTNCKVDYWFTDYLATSSSENPFADHWDTAFMNPPYSNPLPFIKKAYEDSVYCKIVALIKADTSTKTWGVFWDYTKHKPNKIRKRPVNKSNSLLSVQVCWRSKKS